MNLGELTVRKNRIAFVSMALIVAGGLLAYQRMGRLEDPEFTIKEALVITPYAGASAEDVSGAMKDPNKGVNNINQTDGVPLQPKFYRVTAVCRETEDSTSPEREIEFMVRVGL